MDLVYVTEQLNSIEFSHIIEMGSEQNTKMRSHVLDLINFWNRVFIFFESSTRDGISTIFVSEIIVFDFIFFAELNRQ